MADYTIPLSEQTYHRFLAIAQANDTPPEDWIDSQLSPSPESLQPLPQLLSGLMGVIDSRVEKDSQPRNSKFGEAIATKLAKQGIQQHCWQYFSPDK